MERPKNKDEYRHELADAFANVLEEKGLSWKKEWTGTGGGAPHNGVNAFCLSVIAMAKGYDDPRWVTMVQIMDRDGKYHGKEKWRFYIGDLEEVKKEAEAALPEEMSGKEMRVLQTKLCEKNARRV